MKTNIFHFSREVQSEIKMPFTREVQVKNIDLGSRSENEMKKLRDREVKFLENSKIIPDILCFGFCTLHEWLILL